MNEDHILQNCLQIKSSIFGSHINALYLLGKLICINSMSGDDGNLSICPNQQNIMQQLRLETGGTFETPMSDGTMRSMSAHL